MKGIDTLPVLLGAIAGAGEAELATPATRIELPAA